MNEAPDGYEMFLFTWRTNPGRAKTSAVIGRKAWQAQIKGLTELGCSNITAFGLTQVEVIK